jgi:uncharacterized repeat protein (TIGR03803 family)
VKYLGLMLALGFALCAGRADSQTLTTLVQFNGIGGTASGQYPYGSLTLVGTRLYGTTSEGGANGLGAVFSVGTNGTNYQNLVSSFTGEGGTASSTDPQGNLTLVGTALYGTTAFGGASNGTVFSVGTDGTNFQNRVSFTGTGGTASGYEPVGSLTPAFSGLWVYGMTRSGGADNDGTVFSLGTNGGSYQNLVSFTGSGGAASGAYPGGSLTLVGTNLYGMTSGDYSGGYGNIFSVGVNGASYQNLVSFTGSGGAASGAYPGGSLTLIGTRLYGMTRSGGANGLGNVFSVGMDGTSYQNLVSFTGGSGTANGEYPEGSLILSGTDLYGMTEEGGANGYGNIFSVGLDGSEYQDLYNFAGVAIGEYPNGDLLLSGGTLFGMTEAGGASGQGTVFAYTMSAPTPKPCTLALAGGASAMLFGAYRWRRRRPRRSNRAPPPIATRPAGPASPPSR